jgi:hypothetical protein
MHEPSMLQWFKSSNSHFFTFNLALWKTGSRGVLNQVAISSAQPVVLGTMGCSTVIGVLFMT